MFELKFQVLAEDQLRLRYLTQSIDETFKEICEPVKIGASYICSPNQDTLILIYFSSQSIKDMNILLKIISNNAMYITQIMRELNNRLKMQGFHITLLETSSISL
ncbi:MAG: hypothetical protein QW550_01985 [Saccharolobus sp.]